MNKPCDCCTGAESLTPQPIANRPGLGALAYRVGTHAVFLETMQARLSGASRPELAGLRTREADDPSIALLDAWATVADVLTFYQERLANEGYLRTATERRSVLELARLIGYTPRPGVASTVYLAYTMEKDAVGEVPLGTRAQSVPGPGELPQSFETVESIAARAEWNNLQPRMNVPQQITLANVLTIEQVYFEGTSTNLKLNDRLLLVFGDEEGQQALRRVQAIQPDFDANRTRVTLHPLAPLQRALDTVLVALLGILESVSPEQAQFVGSARRNLLDERQLLLLDSHQLDFSTGALAKQLSYLTFSYTNPLDQATINQISPLLNQLRDLEPAKVVPPPKPLTVDLANLIGPLLRPPSIQPRNSQRLRRNLNQVFGQDTDVLPQLLVRFNPLLETTLYRAWANATVSRSDAPLQAVYAFRLVAPLFGYNTPKEPQYEPTRVPSGEGTRLNERGGQLKPQSQWPDWDVADDEHSNKLFLDNAYDQLTSGEGRYVLIKRRDTDTGQQVVLKVVDAQARARSAYGLNAKTTELMLSGEWWSPPADDGSSDDFSVIRNAIVYAQTERLPLADQPYDDEVAGATIELDRLYDGLRSGRWIVVTGERTDIPGTTGVIASELAMVTGVSQTPTRPGDKTHTTLALYASLAFRFKRSTVTIAGNVAKATHGETRAETLGAGDASQPFQTFALRQPPLTYVAAPTPSGAASTLHVYVNSVEWHEAEDLIDLEPTDRVFITRTDDDGKTAVVFGDGVRGARLPTGVENIRAKYRSGIGKVGNVKAEQVSLLSTRPLGVKSVVNPLRASGGADKETRDLARATAPLSTLALDRLVSVQDYADFARMFAGIGKASAARLSDGQRLLVHVTIAGVDDIPIDPSSDLFKNLRLSLRQNGDPYFPVQVALRNMLALVISANVRLLPDYLWEDVEQRMRARLLDAFGFERRDLGQPTYLSEVVSTIQGVAGVAYVDIDLFDGVPEPVTDADLASLAAKLAELVAHPTAHPLVHPLLARPNRAFDATKDTPDRRILPAQLAYLTPAVPDTLILKELTS